MTAHHAGGSRHAGTAWAVALVMFALTRSGCRDTSDGAVSTTDTARVVIGTVGPSAPGGVPSVITLEPQAIRQLPPPTEPAVMDQFGLTFIPGLLVVRLRQRVEFRNSEEVAHTVRVVEATTDSMLFDAAPSIGDPFRYAFDQAGWYDVSCDIHPGMTAFVLVVSTPYAVAAAPNGDFSLSAVPPGSYMLRVWHPDPALRMERVVEIGEGRTELNLTTTP